MARRGTTWSVWRAVLTGFIFTTSALGQKVLQTDGFTNCESDATIKVEKVNIYYNNDNKTVTFDLAGSSEKDQNVTAYLDVTAYGKSVFTQDFNPCDAETFIGALCPLPKGPFSAWGSQEIPTQFADMIPGIAFSVPDIAAQATLMLKKLDSDENVACIQSQVTNGKSVNLPAVPYVAVGIAGVALIASSVSAVSSVAAGGAAGGGGTLSPGFTEVVGWFQGMAMNGMLSVNYPPIYRSFTKNFAFSTGLIAWEPLQKGIDNFRNMTGGNLTRNSVDALKNTTLVFPDGSTNSGDRNVFKVKRSLETFATLVARQAEDDEPQNEFQKTVSGIKAFAEDLQIPSSDIFMTILMIVAIVIAAIVMGILLFKVILEVWALHGNFPEKLTGFRKHYWGTMARTITNLILVLYGIWALWCVYQFTQGDSWGAIALAAVTLAIFTGILAFFAIKIYLKVQLMKRREGDVSSLYDDKETWTKYSLFYDSYRRGYWWLFTPVIAYSLVKGCVLAGADGLGRAQTIAVLIIESLMLMTLIWFRPFERKSGNVINIILQVVRVLSMACILVFVEEFGFEQTTQTVTGVVLIAVQSTLTALLVILIAWNAINACCQTNRHRARRKEMEKLRDEEDDLTSLHARNTLLIDRTESSDQVNRFLTPAHEEKNRGPSTDWYTVVEEGRHSQNEAPTAAPMFRTLVPTEPANPVNHGWSPVDGAGSIVQTPQELKGVQPTFPQFGTEYRGQPTGGYRGY